MDQLTKLLIEISAKLDIIMMHCFVKDGRVEKSFYELYLETVPKVIITETPSDTEKEVIEYALRSGPNSYNIEHDTKTMVVEYKGVTYRIPLEKVYGK